MTASGARVERLSGGRFAIIGPNRRWEIEPRNGVLTVSHSMFTDCGIRDYDAVCAELWAICPPEITELAFAWRAGDPDEIDTKFKR